MRADRRKFVLGLGALGAAAAGGALSCNRPDRRAQALAATVERVPLPDARDIAHTSNELVDAVQRLMAAPAGPVLQTAQDTWRRAALAWQHGFAFQHGPFVRTGALLRASFWPARRAAIAAFLTGGDAIDAEHIELLGVDTKGMFAIEHVLFEAGPVDTAPGPWLAGAYRERALTLVLALARDVKGYAERGVAAIGDGERFKAELVRAGQHSLNRLVDQMLGAVENAAVRLDRVLRHNADHTLRAADVLGAPSGLSTQVLQAWLSVAERSYGPRAEASLATLLRDVAPAIEHNTSKAFAAAISALSAIGAPLEQVVQTDRAPLTAALGALKSLEVALRTELASALGLTLLFTSADGD